MAAGPDDVGGPGFAVGRGKRVLVETEVATGFGVHRGIEGGEEGQGAKAVVEDEDADSSAKESSDGEEESSDGEEETSGAERLSESSSEGEDEESTRGSDDGKGVNVEKGIACD